VVPFFKPDYSPSLLLSMNYPGRPLAVRASLLERLSITSGEAAAHGLYDVVLRCTEGPHEIHHVPVLLGGTDGG
jgi:hypothetical protein